MSATPQEMISALIDARNAIAVNSGALRIVGEVLGVTEGIRDGLRYNDIQIARIDKIVEDFYTDEPPAD